MTRSLGIHIKSLQIATVSGDIEEIGKGKKKQKHIKKISMRSEV
jgi:hypothetical protein